MKNATRSLAALLLALLALPCAAPAQVQPSDDPVGQATAAYFAKQFANLKAVADRQPTPETFREAMKPLADDTEGFFGGSIIDTNFVIREVYYPRDFLARVQKDGRPAHATHHGASRQKEKAKS